MRATTVRLKDIVATLLAVGAFGVMVKCIRAADMVKILADTDRIFTLFAPNDAAFRKLVPGGQLRTLLDDKARLTRVVNYHILPGVTVRPEHFDGRKQLPTRYGPLLMLDAGSGLRVNTATVIRSDIECANGVIHEIDTVLLPPGPGLRTEY